MINLTKFELNKFKKKDINFFEIKKATNQSTSTDSAFLLIPLGIVCIMGAIYGFNSIRLNNIENKYIEAENKLKSFNLAEKQPILEKYTLTRDILSTYNSWVVSLNEQLRYYKTVDPELFTDFMKQTKDLVECNDVVFKNNSLEFNGTAMSITDISKFQEKCEELGCFEDVFVHSIDKETIEKDKSKTGYAYDHYLFLISATFKSYANEEVPEETQAPASSAAPKN